MADTPRGPELPDIPEALAVPASRWSVQLVWVVPLVAALIGGWLAVRAIMDRGPIITVSFKTAEGLEAGKTKIRLKDVEVGLVKSVALSEDTRRVVVTADLVKGTERYLVEDARFWVVRPRISGGIVSGLGTLLSGPFIAMDIGASGKTKRDFVGLDEPPVITSDVAGREFVLHSADIGSLDVGSPVYFRRLQAGQIAGYDLDRDGKGVTLKVFINAPYDRYVTANTRFWHASGIDVTLDASGIKVDTQSLAAIVLGGIAFETPPNSEAVPAATADIAFTLFANRAEALKNPEREVLRLVMVFNESVRGLALGAPVDFRGIVVGEVAAINIDIDPATRNVVMPVDVDIYPDRWRTRSLKSAAVGLKILAYDASKPASQMQAFYGLLARGLRAQLRTKNLLTGQLYIALDFFPDAPKITFDPSKTLREVPTTRSSLRELQSTITAVAAKIEGLPLEDISNDLRQTLQNANKLIQRLDAELAPEAHAALGDARKALGSADRALRADSPLQQDAREAMREFAYAARAFRVLADYLERHPEALLRGKKEDQ